MAFFDEVNKAIGKATQGIADAAQSIGTFTKSIGDSFPKPRTSSPITKCPHCNQPLNGISAVCPLCGYELRAAGASVSITDLSRAIEAIERKRNIVADSKAMLASKRSINPTDEKIASLVRNFVVPNTKEDIFEFMLLASGNIDAKLLAGKKGVEGLSEMVVNAWHSKFEQTYQKAKITFGNDPDFKKIQEVYDLKNQEIKKAKSFFSFGRK